MIDFISYGEQAEKYSGSLDSIAHIITGCVEGLRYRLYQNAPAADDVIIVYHGGGVNQTAGYDILARQLAVGQGLAICLADMRGHGDSAGKRGAVERPERIWRDVDVMLETMRDCLPEARRHLLGHSSGAGMLLNYFTCYQPEQLADSLIMLAPELGPFSGTGRKASDTAGFAHSRQWPFIVNALSGGRWLGDYPAVRLNFPPDVLELMPGFVRQYSVNMANALTPRHPAKQLHALPLPTLFLAAAQDELFSPEVMRAFADKHGNAQLEFQCMENSTHLGCVFEAYRYVQRYIANWRRGE